MKFNSGKWLAWAIPVLFIIIIEICRYSPVWAEGYARQVYPVISAGLSAFSALFPFSLGDCCIVAACFWLLFYPFYAYRKKKGGKTYGFIPVSLPDVGLYLVLLSLGH